MWFHCYVHSFDSPMHIFFKQISLLKSQAVNLFPFWTLLSATFFQNGYKHCQQLIENIFIESAHWADSIIESRCPLYVCMYVCMFVPFPCDFLAWS